MDNLIKSCSERDINGVIRFFRQEKYPTDDYERGSIILENVIINQDVEILEILLKNKIVFNEDILNVLPYTSEEIFILIDNYIKKNYHQLNINFKKKPDFLIDLCKSYSSTEKMFYLSLENNRFDIEYKDFSGKKLIHFIVCFGKKGFMKYLKNYNINYMEKDDNGYTIFDYSIKKEHSSIFYEVITISSILKTLFAQQYGSIASRLLYK